MRLDGDVSEPDEPELEHALAHAGDPIGLSLRRSGDIVILILLDRSS
jgi:hypothetical protein